MKTEVDVQWTRSATMECISCQQIVNKTHDGHCCQCFKIQNKIHERIMEVTNTKAAFIMPVLRIGSWTPVFARVLTPSKRNVGIMCHFIDRMEVFVRAALLLQSGKIHGIVEFSITGS